jgi:hypothetical protein
MDEREWLAERFEENRTHLRAVAYRMLGSLAEADDAVQETWLRLNRSDPAGIENLAGWLTAVAAECASTCCSLGSPVMRSRSTYTCPTRSSVGRTGPTLSRRRCWPTRWDSPCSWSLRSCLRVSVSRSSCPTRSRCPLRNSLSSWGVPPWRHGNLRAAAVAGSKEMLGSPRPIRPGSARSSTPFSPPAAMATSKRFFGCSTPRSCFEPMLASRPRQGCPAVRVPWPSRVVAFGRRIGPRFSVRLALVNGVAGIVGISDGRLASVLSFAIADGRIVEIDILADPKRLASLHVTDLVD